MAIDKKYKSFDWVGVSIVVALALALIAWIGFQVSNFKEELHTIYLHQEETSNQVMFQRNLQSERNTPHAVYGQLRQALLANDLEGTLELIHPAYVYKYEDGLAEAAKDGRLPEAAERLTPLKEKIYDDNVATVVYEIEQIPGNDDPNPLNNHTRSIEFTRTDRGYWRISSI